ncbi:branched-chain amino acid transaminase [Candidatus Nitrosocosmicus franklandus]|uniref:Branched-chain-amino-acid aminotransferase n=1 Tax=Candidatus Nitrosocosmicus franklandianus TaxID=1798806 RepID=A0A484IDP2_9ARCH|nr:branched-chain amino acid transaminase [Candidatus Nitrosocosmicus franklandus]VFJ13094.1 putative branched-chain-amino-acid aminotransferase [Candidatus Nitrosocosmicus franklandus]
MLESDKIWLDGQSIDYNDAKVHVLTHGLHYGTGIFEGIRSYATESGHAIFRLDDHIKRLYNSGKAYFMQFDFTPDEIKKATINVVKANRLGDCYVRIIAFYGYGKLGVNPLPNKVSIAITAWKWTEHIRKEDLEQGIHMMVSSWEKVGSKSLPTHAKGVANYANSALARMEALKSGFDEAILLNSNGHVVEASAENIFLAKNGVLYTPPISSGALEGITRDTVIAIAQKNNIKVIFDNISRDELYYFDEIFLTGTASEIVPVGYIDHRKIGHGHMGYMTSLIREQFAKIVTGREKSYQDWLTYL